MTAPLTIPGMAAHQLARNNFDLFVRMGFSVLEPGTKLSWAWYLDAMAAALIDVERGDCLRLMITIPPRHMKSLIGSVMFPAWVLGRSPSRKLMCVSYSQDLATGHSLTFRRLIQSEFYRCVFPQTATSFIRTSEDDLETKHGGSRLSTSLAGTMTGFGADYILIDDLMKAQDASFPEARKRVREIVDKALVSRLNDKARGRIISIQQRLHQDDLVAHFKEKGGFRELEFPAIAEKDEAIPLTHGRVHHRKLGDVLNPARESKETLERLRLQMGNRDFEAQYQQNPVASGTVYIDWNKIQRYDIAPERGQLMKVVQSWDTATSQEIHADYSVGTTWGYDGEAWLLLDVIRARLNYHELIARARLARERWRATLILAENASVGKPLVEELYRDYRCEGPREYHAPSCRAQWINPVIGKEERMMSQVERLYEGFAKIPREAPWLSDLQEEFRSFPEGHYDDQVDSVSQFLRYAYRLGPHLYDDNYRAPSIRQPGKPLRSRCSAPR